MNTANSGVDTSPFISCAKKQMGDFQTFDTLAGQFKYQTDLLGLSDPPPKSFYPNFWQIGCVFDTILDYFLVLKEAGDLAEGDKTLMKQLMPQAVRGYQYGIAGLAAAWYDDWCWWGIAAAKAFDADYEDIFGDQLEFFQTAAIDLWGLVDAGDFATLANRIPGDIWADSAFNNDGTNFTKFTSKTLSDRSQIHKGTRNAWALIMGGEDGEATDRQKADYDYFTKKDVNKWAKPRFDGGCWQYDLSTYPFPPDDGPDWKDPKPNANNLGVFQVTLMSGLYLSFACSLMAAARRKAAENKSGNAWDRLKPYEDYRQPAEKVVDFLTRWFKVEGSDSLVKAFRTGSLVHERTPTYAPLPNGYPTVHYYSPGAYWSGDQGLIMGALKQYSQLVSAHPPETLDETTEPIFVTYPMELLKGVFYNMPAQDLPWPAHDLPDAVGPYLELSGPSPLSGDDNDYGSGSGIFWRYVLRCCRLDPSFKAEAIKDKDGDPDKMVVKIATTSGTKPNTWGNELFQPFNTVAAAIGAWCLLK